MPYYLTQDMAGILYEQVYVKGEVIYESGDPKID